MILAAGIETVNAGTLKDVLLIAIAGLTVAVYIKQLRRGKSPEPREIHPQPLQVQGVEKIATDRDCNNRHQEVLRQVEKLQDERRKDVGQLHEKINKVDREVAALNKATELQNQTLQSIENKVIRLTERKG